MNARYLSCAETAKLVRKALKMHWPFVKFSVRSSTYSGGASIDVRWIDGPTTHEVESIAKQFQGGGFDGMIDLKYSVHHWIMPDGSLVVDDPGTEGSGGVHPASRRQIPHDDAELVCFGADFIFCNRRYSAATLYGAAFDVAREYGHEIEPDVVAGEYDAYLKNGDFVLSLNGHHIHHSLQTLTYRKLEECDA